MDRNYEQEYKKAFEAAKGLHDAGNALTKKQMEIVFPQLAESEDERIKKDIVAAVEMRGDLTQGRKSEIYAYLEKQKEQKPRIEICPHSTKSKSYKENGYPIEDCDYGLEIAYDILEKTFGEVRGYKTYDGIREHQTAIEAVRKAKEQKPVQSDVEKEYVRTLKSLISDFLRGKEDVDREYYQQIFDWLDGRHIEQKPVDYDAELKKCKDNPLYFFDKYVTVKVKQKPAEKQDYSSLTDFERAIHRGFLSAGVENAPVTIIKETAQECLAQMKPAEWSEEDEIKLASLINYFEGDALDCSTEDMVRWLKSLRPQSHWKPSEEQMKALLKVVDKARELHYSSNSGYDEYDVLRSLYKQLKEL